MVPDSPDLSRLLGHPLRPRILDLLVEHGEASPRRLALQLDQPTSRVAYHVRVLLNAGWVELVARRPRRGAVEHVYRATQEPLLYDAYWRRLPVGVRRRLAGDTVRQICDEAAGALPDGFDAPGMHVARMTLRLDPRGLAELSDLLDDVLIRAAAIQDEAASRGGEGVAATALALLHHPRTITPTGPAPAPRAHPPPRRRRA